MTAQGIDRLVVRKVLNHAESDVTAVYDRYSYDTEKRSALDTWGAYLETILAKDRPSRGNVVRLRPGIG